MIDWRVVLTADDGVELHAPVSLDELARAEAVLGVIFPAALRELYAITDGVFDTTGQWWVVWPLSEVITRNQAAWAQESGARRDLVGFGDNGAGEPFCVPSDGGAGVFVWYPIDGDTERLADTVDQFWQSGPAG